MITQWPCIMPDWHRTDAAGECEEPVCESEPSTVELSPEDLEWMVVGAEVHR